MPTAAWLWRSNSTLTLSLISPRSDQVGACFRTPRTALSCGLRANSRSKPRLVTRRQATLAGTRTSRASTKARRAQDEQNVCHAARARLDAAAPASRNRSICARHDAVILVRSFLSRRRPCLGRLRCCAGCSKPLEATTKSGRKQVVEFQCTIGVEKEVEMDASRVVGVTTRRLSTVAYKVSASIVRTGPPQHEGGVCQSVAVTRPDTAQ
eukprot:4808527-Prymnesium_polylepis.2